MRVGILTGGGDAPGLNGVVESVARVLLKANVEVLGIQDGFEGVFQNRFVRLSEQDVLGYHALAGSKLGASNKSRIRGREAEFLSQFQKLKLDGLIAVGGDGTFSALSNVVHGLKLIGVPKTIDNDLGGTDFTFGFDTACAVVTEAVESLRATAETHSRIFVVETMGRTAGWIALGSGLASYADAILIPENPFSREGLLSFIKSRQLAGQRGMIIVASEGAKAQGEDSSVQFTVKGSPQPERYGGFSLNLSRWIEQETGWESRNLVLGHLQRSRHPTTTDRFLTMTMGAKAAQLVLEHKWGRGVVYRQGEVKDCNINELMVPARLVTQDHQWLKLAKAVGIWTQAQD